MTSSSTPPTEATRADARQNRQRLMAATRSVLARRGLDAEIAEIAAEAQVGVGTVYRNFPTKEALLVEAVREINGVVVAEMAALEKIEDATAALRYVFRAGYQIVGEYGQFVLALIAGDCPPALDAEVNDDAIRDALAAVFEKAIAQKVLPPNIDVELAVALVEALFAPRPLERLLQTRSAEELAEASAAFFIRGVVALGAAPSDPSA